MELSLSLMGQEYDALLLQYEQAYKNYIDEISSGSGSGSGTGTGTGASAGTNTTSFANMKGQTFWGTSGVSEGASNTVEECQGQCSSISNCTGATFNPDKKYCWIRTGEGDVIPGLDNDVAIVPKTKQYSDVLYRLNLQLIDLNKKMIDSNPESSNSQNERELRHHNLTTNYDNLMAEKRRIELMIREYEEVEEINKNSYISVNQKYSSYIAISLFAIIVVILVIIFFLL